MSELKLIKDNDGQNVHNDKFPIINVFTSNGCMVIQIRRSGTYEECITIPKDISIAVSQAILQREVEERRKVLGVKEIIKNVR